MIERRVLSAATCLAAIACASTVFTQSSRIGREIAVPDHVQDGQEFKLSVHELIEAGKRLFIANWTQEDGRGRPLAKGTGQALSDRSRPLTGARAFNRISGPDANSCQGCHNAPYAIAGGGGDVTTNAFELAQRFDFVAFDPKDQTVTGGSPARLALVAVRSPPAASARSQAIGWLEMRTPTVPSGPTSAG